MRLLPARYHVCPTQARNELLDQAAKTGLMLGVEMWQISKCGRHFKIKDGTLFNIIGREGMKSWLGGPAQLAPAPTVQHRPVVQCGVVVVEWGADYGSDSKCAFLSCRFCVLAIFLSHLVSRAHPLRISTSILASDLTSPQIPHTP